VSFPEPRDELLTFKVEVREPAEGALVRSIRFLVTVSRQTQVSLGDEVKLIGQTHQDLPFSYLAKEKVVARMNFPEIEVLQEAPPLSLSSLLKMAREGLQRLTERIYPSPASEFLLALLIGGSHRLPPQIRENFTCTGTQHIMAVSGFNTTIIAFAILFFFRRFSRNLAILMTLLALIFFGLMTGLSPSVTRAAIMTSAYLIGIMAGRPRSSFNILLVAAGLMLLVNPWLLRYDLGFQLSFLSTYGLMTFVPRLSALVKYLPIVGDAALPGVVAVLMTWPLVSLIVGRVSLIAILANALITPLIPLTMLLGVLALAASGMMGKLGLALIPASWGLLNFILFLINTLAQVPGSLVNFAMPVGLVLLYYVFLLLVVNQPWKWLGYRRWQSSC